MAIQRIITRDSRLQPSFHPSAEGFVLMKFGRMEWLVSLAKAEELKSELEAALDQATRGFNRG